MTAPPRPRLLIVVPAWNERAIIAATLDELLQFLSSIATAYAGSILVVDDGSSDGTSDQVRVIAAIDSRVSLIRHDRNRGIGGALKSARDSVAADLFLLVDADLSVGVADLARLLEARKRTGADLVLASPYMAGGAVAGVPLVRRLMSRSANSFLSVCARRRLATFTSMVRLIEAELLRALPIASDGAEMNLELAWGALRRNASIAEVPVELRWPEHRRSGGRIRPGHTAAQIRSVLSWGNRFRNLESLESGDTVNG